MHPASDDGAGRLPRVAAVVLGAGSGSRVGSVHNKVFLPLAGRRVISWSFDAFIRVPSIRRFVMVIRDADRALAEQTVDTEVPDVPVEIIVGGDTRHESELAALRHLEPAIRSGDVDVVLVHDGARPLISPTLTRELIDVAVEHGGVFPGLETDEIRYLLPDGTLDTGRVPRMIRAQTPQVFRALPLLQAYERAAEDGFVGTDTGVCFQQYRDEALLYRTGDPRNIKITYPDDLVTAEEILRHARFRIT
ncbi:IspD/TarI family cytidylyltransferase [Nakamurella deserti]|uniref:IspD/TarI family cytidylyltransferase n=1 Tax=Nakamurella deserti TaxID=2164074 RepID=UPI000DBE8122|nr:IspD/TarI family cytidylyltransferase [Nakamurella deserti]